MSVSRGNWSNLSRLAKQWIEDDEEEQKREKRRRHRDLSSPANRIVEVLSEHDNPCTNSSIVTSLDNEEEEQENQTSTEPQRQVKGTQHEFENSIKGHKEEFEHKVHYDKTLGLSSLEEENENCSSSNTDIQEQEKPNQNNLNSDRQKENKLWNNLNEKSQEPDNSEGKQQTYDIVKEPNQEPNKQKENQMVKKQNVQHEGISTERNNNIQTPNAAKHWKNSTSFSHSVVEKPSDPEIKKSGSATSSTSDNKSFKSQVFVSSVKIQKWKSGITSPPPIPEETIEVPFATTAMSYKQDMALQTSSPFKRFTPLTSSVKIVRLPKTESENQVSSGLRRSSSLRLSLRKIDDRVEKYTSAIKKSASVKIPTSQNQGVLGVSDGIVSKRSIFEKEESTTKSNISKKDLNLPGDVASRINQWSNKIQQSSSASSGLKEIKTGDVASKRMLWQQRSQSSSDTKL